MKGVTTIAWTLDDCARIDMRDWTRERILKDGNSYAFIFAGRGIQVEVDIYPDRVQLSWGYAWQVIELDHTSCNFGGTRPWFLCPDCDRRMQVLYLMRGHWMCWRCTRLSYGSQVEKPLYRLMRRAKKLRRRLGGPESLFLPFPWKPERMRWQTYAPLRRQGLALEARINEGMKAFAAEQRARIEDLRRKIPGLRNDGDSA